MPSAPEFRQIFRKEGMIKVFRQMNAEELGCAQHDIDALTIMRQTRHKSEKMVHRYIEQGNIFKDNALSRMYHK
jgi:hypothetical protein